MLTRLAPQPQRCAFRTRLFEPAGNRSAPQNSNGGFLNPACLNNACSYPVCTDAGALTDRELLPLDKAQDHIIFMDRHALHPDMTQNCRCGIPTVYELERPADSHWGRYIHGAAGGNVAIMDGSVSIKSPPADSMSC